MGANPISQQLEELSERIGEFIHYWGFKRIHGKIWCHLYLSKHPLDASELIRRVGVSKALVSISLRELLEHDVIAEAGKSHSGTQLYRAMPNLTAVIVQVLKQRERRMLARIQAACLAVKAGPGIESQRLSQLGAMIEDAAAALDAILALKSLDIEALAENLDLQTAKNEP